MILQIIGVLLLLLLGIIVALLLCILFIPIRYRIQVEYLPNEEEKSPLEILKLRIRIGWLFRLLLFRVTGENGQFPYQIKVFGITIMDSRNSSEEKEKKDRKGKKREKKGKQPSEERQKERKEEKHSQIGRENYKQQKEQIYVPDCLKEEEESKVLKKEQADSAKENNYLPKPAQSSYNKKDKGIFQRMKEKIIGFFQGCKAFIQGIKKKIQAIIYNGNEIKERIKKIYYFFQNFENKKGLKAVKKQIIEMIKHIAPTKIKGYLAFGMEDPSVTGKILGGIAILYCMIGEKLQIRPNFQEKQLELMVDIRGRIRIFTLLKYMFILWKKKEIRKLIENYNQLKEEL